MPLKRVSQDASCDQADKQREIRAGLVLAAWVHAVG